MKKSYLLYLALCVILFTATVFAGSCGDNTIDSNEQCDDGGVTPGDGCDENCGIENNWDCTTSGGPGNCYQLNTYDSFTLYKVLKNLYVTANNGNIKAFDIAAITSAGVSLPTITVSDPSIFDVAPHVDATTGNIVWTLFSNQTAEAEQITLTITVQVQAGLKRSESAGVEFTPSGKRVVTPGQGAGEFTVEWEVSTSYCPLEVEEPNGEPNKKLTCYKAETDHQSKVFYLKRVPQRPIVEFQPGDIFMNGVLDCNCVYTGLKN